VPLASFDRRTHCRNQTDQYLNILKHFSILEPSADKTNIQQRKKKEKQRASSSTEKQHDTRKLIKTSVTRQRKHLHATRHKMTPGRMRQKKS
jgi:hypothetical protein